MYKTTPERRLAIVTILSTDEHAEWSLREIMEADDGSVLRRGTIAQDLYYLCEMKTIFWKWTITGMGAFQKVYCLHSWEDNSDPIQSA